MTWTAAPPVEVPQVVGETAETSPVTSQPVAAPQTLDTAMLSVLLAALSLAGCKVMKKR